MDLRIDSVYSLSCKTTSAQGLYKERYKEQIEQFCEEPSLTKDRYCVVSLEPCAVLLERIDISNDQHVSYRRWMKSHKHCDSGCYRRGKPTTENVNSPNRNSSRMLRKRTRNIESDIPEKKQKSQERIFSLSKELKCETATHLSFDSGTKPISGKKRKSQNLNSRRKENVGTKSSGFHVEVSKEIKMACDNIKVEPEESTFGDSFGNINAVEVKKQKDTVPFQIKGKPESEEKFEDVCKQLSKAAKGDRASYIERLKTMLENEEKEEKKSQSCGDGTKTIASLQVINIDGQTYITPAQDNQNIVQAQHMTVKNPNKSRNKDINVVSPKSNTENKTSDTPITTNMLHGNLPSIVECPISVPPKNNNLVIVDSGRFLDDSGKKRQNNDINGHLVTHEGKSFFIPLQKGQTFKSRPRITLECVNPVNPNTTAKVKTMATNSKQQQEISKQSPTPVNNQTPILLPPNFSIQKNNAPSTIPSDLSNLIRIIPDTLLTQNMIQAPVTDILQNIQQPAISQIPLTVGLNTVGLNNVNPCHPQTVNNINPVKMNNTGQQSINDMGQKQINSFRLDKMGTSNNGLFSHLGNSGLPSVNTSIPKVVVPLCVNGTIQNILVNVGPSGNDPNKTVGGNSSEINLTATGVSQNNVFSQQADKQSVSSPLIPVMLNGGQIQMLQPPVGIGVNSIQNPILNQGAMLNINQILARNPGQSVIPVAKDQNISAKTTHVSVSPSSNIVSERKNQTLGGNVQLPSNQGKLTENIRFNSQNSKTLVIPHNPTAMTGHIQQRFPVKIQQNLPIPTSGTTHIMTGPLPPTNKPVTSVNMQPQSDSLQLFVLTNNGLQKVEHDLSYQTTSSQVTSVKSSSSVRQPLGTTSSQVTSVKSSSSVRQPVGTTSSQVTSVKSSSSVRKPLGTAPTEPSVFPNASPIVYTMPMDVNSKQKYSWFNRFSKTGSKWAEYSPNIEQIIETATKNITVSPVQTTTKNITVSPVQTTSKPQLEQRTLLVSPFCNAPSVSLGSTIKQDKTMLRNVNKQTVLTTVIPAQGYSKSGLTTKTSEVNSNQPIKPKPRNELFQPTIQHYDIERTFIPQTQSENLSNSHPILHQTLQNNVGNNIDTAKRNKRKPQVVVRIDQDEINEDEEDCSVFQPIPNTDTSSISQTITLDPDSTIVEKGLRIPESMLADLQKKQLSVETAIQKLMNSKMVKK